ncbi:hypothetical protein BD779DRAFT_1560484 [Infundibulicybe gibba]|nr:hypothetical protein BD779DRAFT_1560484 [Infundibulicybe gibba]
MSTQGLVARLITTIALGYSGNWNARRLENPFHAFWSLVLGEWISDLHPHAFLIPQYQIDTIEQTPGPDDSVGTITRGDANEITPDFAIAIADLISRATGSPIPPTPFPSNFDSWRDVKLTRLLVPALAELKRPPPRSQELEGEFIEKLFASFSVARRQLLAQAKHVFIKYPYMDQVILIACIGEWWSWRIAARTDFISVEPETILDETIHRGRMGRVPSHTPISGNAQPPRTDNASPIATSGQRRSTQKATPGTRTSRTQRQGKLKYNPGRRRTAAEKEEERARTRIFHRHDDLPAHEQEQPGGDEQAILERSLTRWSKYILFGTEASAQHFSILHGVLEKQVPQVPDASQQPEPAEYDLGAESGYEEGSDSEGEWAWDADPDIEVEAGDGDGEGMDIDPNTGDWGYVDGR